MKFATLALLLLSPLTVNAAPNGASQCLLGGPSVAGAHLSAPDVTTGSLADGGFQVRIGGPFAIPIRPDASGSTTTVIGRTFDIEIRGADLKGFLVKVLGTTADDGTPLGTESKDMMCPEGIAAATHSSNTPKTKVGLSLEAPAAGVYTVEIDVVGENSGGVSTYYFSSINVTVQSSVEDIAAAEDDLSTFTAAVGLVGPGRLWLERPNVDFTVFAPIDDALATIPGYLLEPNWVAHLADTLSYHVVEGIVLSSDIMNGDVFAPLKVNSYGAIYANISGGDVLISGRSFSNSMVVGVDLQAANGVVHKVDQVFLPFFLTQNLYDIALSQPDEIVGELQTLLMVAGREDALRAPNRTILVPVGSAFDNLPADVQTAALEDAAVVAEILDNHIAEGVFPNEFFEQDLEITMLSGQVFKVNVVGGLGTRATRTIGATTHANITAYDILASNGIAHTLDAVLLDGTSVDPNIVPTSSPTMAPAAPTDTTTSMPSASSYVSAAVSALFAGIMGILL